MTVFQQKKKEEKKNVKMSTAEARSRAVWASHTQSRALTTELLELLLQLAKFRIDIDSYYIFKLQLLFTLSRDCHLLSHSNCCFHYRSTVTRLDTLTIMLNYLSHPLSKKTRCLSPKKDQAPAPNDHVKR